MAHRLLVKIGRIPPCRTSQPFILRSSPPAATRISRDLAAKLEKRLTGIYDVGIPVVPGGYPWFVIVRMPRISLDKSVVPRTEEGEGSVGEGDDHIS